MEIDNKLLAGLAAAVIGSGGVSLDAIVDGGKEKARIEEVSAEAMIMMTTQINYAWKIIPELREELKQCVQGGRHE